MRYAHYQNLVPSGLPWLGDIPSHWSIVQSRRLFAQRKERARSDDEQLTASQKYGIISQKKYMVMENQRVVQVLSGSEILKHVEPNDFVMSMRSFQGGLEWCKETGCVSSAYVGLIPLKSVVPEFFSYLLKSRPYIRALQSTSNLVRDGQALRFDNFTQVSLPVVPDIEQHKIANFLDHETAKIDTLIEKQQQLIKLLKEKRQAVISHAVTKGLNSDVPMKDSGVEWLGEVPAGWKVSRMKYSLNSIEQGWSPQCSSSPAGDNEYGVLKVGCVNHGLFNENENKALPNELKPQTQYSLKKDDLLISRANTRELVGSAAVVPADRDNLLLCDKLYRLRFKEGVKPHFIAYYLTASAVRQQIELGASGASHSMQNIGQSTILELQIPLIPGEEFERILTYLEYKTNSFDACESKVLEQLKLLKERRTALISAAVTGKIDVRNWQASESTSTSSMDR